MIEKLQGYVGMKLLNLGWYILDPPEKTNTASFWRVLIVGNAILTAFLIYEVLKLYGVMDSFGVSLNYMADVFGYTADILFKRIEELEKIVRGTAAI